MRYFLVAIVLLSGCGKSEKEKRVEAVAEVVAPLVQASKEAAAEEAKAVKEAAKNLATLNKPLSLGGVEVTLTRVSFGQAKAREGFGGPPTTVEGALRIEFDLKNTTDGEVFDPSTYLVVTDNFGNKSAYDLNLHFLDITLPKEVQPGQSVKCVEIVKLKNPKAKSATAVLSTTKNNKNEKANWSVEIDLSKL